MGDYRMRRDLALPIMPAPLPAGMHLVPFDKRVANDARELLRRVYPEGLNDGGISFEGFWDWLTHDPGYDPELMFVASSNGMTVGFCHCWRAAYVKNLAVDARFRHRGIGAALLTLAIEEFARRGATSVDLETEPDNQVAQSLYRRLGFVVVAEDD